jgi:hypothetical protein
MELIEAGADRSVTLKFRSDEFSKLLQILDAFGLALEEGKIDMAALFLTEAEAEEIVEAFEILDEKALSLSRV